jgi:hypothetical protein
MKWFIFISCRRMILAVRHPLMYFSEWQIVIIIVVIIVIFGFFCTSYRVLYILLALGRLLRCQRYLSSNVPDIALKLGIDRCWAVSITAWQSNSTLFVWSVGRSVGRSLLYVLYYVGGVHCGCGNVLEGILHGRNECLVSYFSSNSLSLWINSVRVLMVVESTWTRINCFIHYKV